MYNFDEIIDTEQELCNKYFDGSFFMGSPFIVGFDIVDENTEENMAKDGFKRGDFDPEIDESIELWCETKSGNKYRLHGYKNCEVRNKFLLVNNETKLYREICIDDLKNIDLTKPIIYKGKYVCFYKRTLIMSKYKGPCYLFFLNRNQYLFNPSVYELDDIRNLDDEFIKEHYLNTSGTVPSRKIKPFLEVDDFSINLQLKDIYLMTMMKQYSYTNNKYKDIFDKTYDLYKKDRSHVIRYFIGYAEDDAVGLDFDFVNFCEKYFPIDYFLNKIKKKSEIWKNIKNNIWLQSNFLSMLNEYDDYYIQGEDFSFLILNAIKALEILLYDIVSKAGLIQFNEYDSLDQIMLGKLIRLISENKAKLIRHDIHPQVSDKHFELYIKKLQTVKDECRNGFFHKDRIITYNDLYVKRDLVYSVIIESIGLFGDYI